MENGADTSDTVKPIGDHGSLTSYTIGFILSIILTLAAYYVVQENLLSGTSLIAVIVSLAVSQILVQLIFFLHLHSDSKPYWNILCLLFMLLVVVIIVWGSLWIMHHLNERVMPSMSSLM